MAITPFTKPMQMGEFIPQTPRLPVESIAGATQSVYEQDVRQRERRNKILSQAAKQKAAAQDRPALEQFEQRLQREFESLAEDDMLFGDREEITRLARMAEEELSKVEQARKLRQQQQKVIEENIKGEQRQRTAKAAARSPGLRVTEDGRIDPDSLPSVVSFGTETGNLYDVGVEAFNDLKERTLRQEQFSGVRRDIGAGRFTEVTGVDPKRIEQSVRNEFASNTEVQNWKDNTMKVLERRYQQQGVNSQAAREKARKVANKRLDTIAKAVANDQAYKDINTSWQDLADGTNGGTGTDGRQEIVIPGSGLSKDQFEQGSAGYIEMKEREEQILEDEMDEEFSQSEQNTIEKLRQRSKRIAKNKPDKIVDVYESQGMSKAITPQVARQTSADAIFKDLMQQQGLWKQYDEIHNNVREQLKSPEFGPNYFMPSGSQSKMSTKIGQVRDSLIPMANKITPEDVKVQTESGLFDWGKDREDIQNNFRSVIGNTQNIAISSDGRFLQLITDQSVQGDDEGRFENRVFRVPTSKLTNSQLNNITRMFSEDAQKTIDANIRYRNIPITEDKPLNISNSVRVRKDGRKTYRGYVENYYVERKDETEYKPVRYQDILENTDDPQTAVREITRAARRMNYTALTSTEDVQEAVRSYQNHQENGTSLSPSAKQLQDLLESQVNLRHRGSAVEFGQRIGQ